jgi:hypothetical protein
MIDAFIYVLVALEHSNDRITSNHFQTTFPYTKILSNNGHSYTFHLAPRHPLATRRSPPPPHHFHRQEPRFNSLHHPHHCRICIAPIVEGLQQILRLAMARRTVSLFRPPTISTIAHNLSQLSILVSHRHGIFSRPALHTHFIDPHP